MYVQLERRRCRIIVLAWDLIDCFDFIDHNIATLSFYVKVLLFFAKKVKEPSIVLPMGRACGVVEIFFFSSKSCLNKEENDKGTIEK